MSGRNRGRANPNQDADEERRLWKEIKDKAKDVDGMVVSLTVQGFFVPIDPLGLSCRFLRTQGCRAGELLATALNYLPPASLILIVVITLCDNPSTLTLHVHLIWNKPL